ncbi:hypothetical protein [Spiroplasma endosymbiont of Othius punctulatus]|uniref:hypothetical protein n=1 Tax=Spiroplasma endosymbiont of Othius punctulatus TaxID=3066289 RepID=UPI0030CB7967
MIFFVIFLPVLFAWLFIFWRAIYHLTRLNVKQGEKLAELLSPTAKEIIEQKHRNIKVLHVNLNNYSGSKIEYEYSSNKFWVDIDKVVHKKSKHSGKNAVDDVGTGASVVGSIALSVLFGDAPDFFGTREQKKYITTHTSASVSTNKFNLVGDFSFKKGTSTGLEKANTESIEFNEIYAVEKNDTKNTFLFFTPKNIELLITNNDLFAKKYFTVNNTSVKYEKYKEQGVTGFSKSDILQYETDDRRKKKLANFACRLLESAIEISLSELNQIAKCSKILEI